MYETVKIAKEVRRIVGHLSDDRLLPVSKQVIAMLKAYYGRFAQAMREHRYDPNQAVVRMVTSLAVFGEQEGANTRLKLRNPALYQDFQNLYRFCGLAYSNEPDRIGAAFCVLKTDGDPKPFSESNS